MAKSSGDIQKRNFIGVATIPQSPNQVAASGSLTLNPGNSHTFKVRNIPNGKELSIWNFLFSIVVDDITIGTWPDGEVNYFHLFPSGPQLTVAQANLNLMQWLDWASSSDANNIRIHNIRLTNNDTATHNYYLFYKAYTMSTAAGL